MFNSEAMNWQIQGQVVEVAGVKASFSTLSQLERPIAGRQETHNCFNHLGEKSKKSKHEQANKSITTCSRHQPSHMVISLSRSASKASWTGFNLLHNQSFFSVVHLM